MPAWSELLTPELAALASITLVAGLVRGFTGFGAGMIMAPLFSVLIGPARAVPVLVLLEWVASARLVPAALRLVDRRSVLALALPACLAVPLGGWLLTRLPPNLVRRVISMVVLAFVVLVASGRRYRGEPGFPSKLVTGGLSGLLTGIGGVGGPPVVLFLLSGPSTAELNRATLIVFFAITQITATIAFAIGGLVDAQVLWTTLLLSPLFWAGTHAGAWLFEPRRETIYRRVALALLGAAGLVGLL